MQDRRNIGLRRAILACGLMIGGASAWAIPADLAAGERFGIVAIVASLVILAGWQILEIVRPAPRNQLRPPKILASDHRGDGIAGVIGVEADVPGFEGPFRRFVPGSRLSAITPQHKPHQAAGLVGRVVLIPVFVGRDGRSWQPEEIRSTLKELDRAARWIVRQAQARSIDLDLTLSEVYFEGNDPRPADPQAFRYGYQGDELIPGGPELVVEELASFSRAAADLGFEDASDLVAKLSGRFEADSVAWVMFPLRSGLSFAVRASDGHLDGVNLAVCYARYSDFSATLKGPVAVDPATLAHEILHLFGAEDKYGRPLDDSPGAGVTSRDVMRLDSSRLSQLSVDDATAAEIGWSSPRRL